MTASPISSPGWWKRATNEILVALSPAHSCQPWLKICPPVEQSPLVAYQVTLDQVFSNWTITIYYTHSEACLLCQPSETPVSSDSGDLQMKGSDWSDFDLIFLHFLLERSLKFNSRMLVFIVTAAVSSQDNSHTGEVIGKRES
ncbi:uncharacterized protein LOC144291817 [Canis aureus]